MSTHVSADLSPGPTHVGREIRHQPDAWATALDRLPEVAGVLPQPGERVAVIGCGTSWFMAAAYASLREQLGLGETDAFAASQFPADRSYDRVVAISRSGTTTEVVRAIQATTSRSSRSPPCPGLPCRPPPRVRVVLDFADEESVVQTVFATTVLMLLRASLGESLEPVLQQAADVLDGSAPLPGCTGVGRPDHLPRAGLGLRRRPGGGAEDARGRAAVDRVLPADGVPPRADLDRRAGPRGLGVRPVRSRASRTTSRPPARRWSTTTSTRSRTWCGPSCSPYAAQRPSGSIRTGRAT